MAISNLTTACISGFTRKRSKMAKCAVIPMALGLDAECGLWCRRLGCIEGRSAKAWVDYSLFGHQIVCHEVKGYNANGIHNAVDGDPVPVPHFGLALTPKQFHSLAEKVQKEGVEFVLQPHLRFKGMVVP